MAKKKKTPSDLFIFQLFRISYNLGAYPIKIKEKKPTNNTNIKKTSLNPQRDQQKKQNQRVTN